MTSKIYAGIRGPSGKAHVHVVEDGDSHALAPRLDLFNHSPTGFAWGFSGSGPAQLALAILADALGDDARALRLHQGFKFVVIAALPQTKDFDITHAEVIECVRELETTPAAEEHAAS